jgi:hypothetical protein
MASKEYHQNYRKEYAKKMKYLNLAIPLTTYQEFEALAKKENTKVSPLIRKMALAYLQQHTFVPQDIVEELRAVKLLIRNVANNVNQVAHHSNTIKGLVNDNDLLLELQRLENMVADYTHKQLKNLNDY